MTFIWLIQEATHSRDRLFPKHVGAIEPLNRPGEDIWGPPTIPVGICGGPQDRPTRASFYGWLQCTFAQLAKSNSVTRTGQDDVREEERIVPLSGLAVVCF